MISLGVDVGGTGAKCVAFQENGEQVAISYREYPNLSGETNLNADALAECTKTVIRECVEQLPDKNEVAVITASSFGESFVPIDAQGNALTDIIMYFADASLKEFDEMVSKFGCEKIQKITKIKPDASYSLAKMMYTLSIPDIKVYKFLLVAGFICYRLSGVCAIDTSLACRTLLYDVEKREWSEEIMKAAGIDRSLLPDVYETGSIIGSLTEEVAAQLGLNRDVKVVIGSHDQIVNALACGISEPGEAMDGSGTCECIEPLFKEIPEDLGFAVENFASVPYLANRGFVTYAYNISGGAVVRWYRNQLAEHLKAQAKAEGISIYDIMNRTCPEEPTDLIVLPFLQGMGGTPDTIPNAKGTIFGLTTATTLQEIYRAILEGLSYEMRYNMERIDRYVPAPKLLYACGGGARSAPWLQIKADVWNCDIVPILTEETGALGSAILGFAAVNEAEDVCEYARKFVRKGETIHPDAEHAKLYDAKYEKFKKLRNLMISEGFYD